MSLTELKPHPKRLKPKRRRGRGDASGRGNYSQRGMKGQSSRSGGKRRPGFEGGQIPLIRRMPKLGGFRNPNKITYQAVNLNQLNVFDDKTTVDAEALHAKGLISKKNHPVKILGFGELEKALTVKAEKFSATAISKIEKAKGTTEVIGKSKKTD